MPLEVMDRIIRATSNPGDLVLDPMSGTFATGASALALGRRFIGFDVSGEYCKSGRARLKKVVKEHGRESSDDSSKGTGTS